MFGATTAGSTRATARSSATSRTRRTPGSRSTTTRRDKATYTFRDHRAARHAGRRERRASPSQRQRQRHHLRVGRDQADGELPRVTSTSASGTSAPAHARRHPRDSWRSTRRWRGDVTGGHVFGRHRRGDRLLGEAVRPVPVHLDRRDRRPTCPHVGLLARDADPSALRFRARSPTRSRTSCRTSGSATACRCARGATSGSTRASPPSPSGCGTSTSAGASTYDTARSTFRQIKASARSGSSRSPTRGATGCSPGRSTTAAE